MSYVEKFYQIESVCPLVMHNCRLANPLDPLVKEMKKVNSKHHTKKTEEDAMYLSECEFKGGLYLSEEGKLVIPSRVWEGVLVNAAKKNRRGTIFKSGVFVERDSVLDIGCKLKTDPDSTANFLWGKPKYKDVRGAVIKGNRVMRTRPIFPEWTCELIVTFDTTQVNEEFIDEAVEIGGSQVGLLEMRPRYGRYRVV